MNKKEEDKFRIVGLVDTKIEQQELLFISRYAIMGIRCRDGKIGNIQ